METPEVPLSPSLSLCGAESAATIAPDSFEVRKRNGAESVEEPRRSLSIWISKTSGMLKMSQCERNVVLMFSSLVQVARPASRPSGCYEVLPDCKQVDYCEFWKRHPL